MKRHKWNGTGGTRRTSNHGGLAVGCVKCGCVREYVKGIVTYLIDDRLHDGKAPQCDGRLLKAENEAKIISSKPPVTKSLPLQKPPYKCSSDNCCYPNCKCEWEL